MNQKSSVINTVNLGKAPYPAKTGHSNKYSNNGTFKIENSTTSKTLIPQSSKQKRYTLIKKKVLNDVTSDRIQINPSVIKKLSIQSTKTLIITNKIQDPHINLIAVPNNLNPNMVLESCQTQTAIIAPVSTSSNNTLHPLSLKSPSIDLEVLSNSQIKQNIENLFMKKLENDIVDHVAQLTEDSNKIMQYRVISYKRLECLVENCFSSKFYDIILNNYIYHRRKC